VLRGTEALPLGDLDIAEELRTIVLPPGARAIGCSLGALMASGVGARVQSVRRQGISGRDPDPAMLLQQGDEVVLVGTPAALEHAEQVLLAG
jgi:CPA2 family monovalent cation:H+ antiporter-2